MWKKRFRKSSKKRLKMVEKLCCGSVNFLASKYVVTVLHQSIGWRVRSLKRTKLPKEKKRVTKTLLLHRKVLDKVYAVSETEVPYSVCLMSENLIRVFKRKAENKFIETTSLLRTQPYHSLLFLATFIFEQQTFFKIQFFKFAIWQNFSILKGNKLYCK